MRGQQGFAAITMILAALILSGILAAMSTISLNKNASGMQEYQASLALVSQASLIRSVISKCALVDYPAGDNGSGLHLAYPYYGTAPNTGKAATGAISGLYCSGSGSDNTSDATDANLWSGLGGVFLPATPVGFNAWQYVNDVTSVRVTIQATNATSILAITDAWNSIGVSGSGGAASRATTTLANDTLVVTITN